jgi:hypothetical protein
MVTARLDAGRAVWLAVAGALVALTVASGALGGLAVACGLRRACTDAGALPVLIGLALVAVALVAGLANLVVLERCVRVGREGTAARAYLLAVLALPIALGVAADVWGRGDSRTLWHPTAGYTVRFPVWLQYVTDERADPTPGAATFETFDPPGSRPDDPRPRLRIVVRPYEGPLPGGEPFAVGDGRYSGTMAASTMHMTTGATDLSVVYAAHGKGWQVAGTFARPPAPDGQLLAAFRGVVTSVHHWW